MAERKLPPDGTHVKAMTLPNQTEDIPGEWVHGKLTRQHVPTFGTIHYWVGGEQVDPDTIEEYTGGDED
jgi:hypothetical protein